MAMVMGAYGAGDPRILGSTPFTCDLCAATGWTAEPCPFHDDKAWAEWLADSLREWVWTIQRDLRRAHIGPSSDPPISSSYGQA